jgi:hypothetical protein
MTTNPDQQTPPPAESPEDWRRQPLPDPFDDRAIQERIARVIAKAAEAATCSPGGARSA